MAGNIFARFPAFSPGKDQFSLAILPSRKPKKNESAKRMSPTDSEPYLWRFSGRRAGVLCNLPFAEIVK